MKRATSPHSASDLSRRSDGLSSTLTVSSSPSDDRRCHPRPQQVFALGWFLSAAYINSVAQALLQTQPHPLSQSLPDLGFDHLRFLPQDAFYADLALFLIDGITFARFLASPRLRFVFLRRRLLTQGIVFLLRAVSISVTPLPNPYPQCQAPAVPHSSGVVALLIMTGLVKTCNDVMFSGHAASMTLSALFLSWHCDADWLSSRLGSSWRQPLSLLMNSMIFVMWIMGLLIVIATRFHYTLDVFIGAVIAMAVFLHYYALVAVVRLIESEGVNELPSEICNSIMKFVAWFESDAKRGSGSISHHV